MAKLNFQKPLLQSSMSQDPFKIILICWYSYILSYISYYSFCNKVKVFTVTFGQCVLAEWKQKRTDPKPLNVKVYIMLIYSYWATKLIKNYTFLFELFP